jgi:hypothetical protein
MGVVTEPIPFWRFPICRLKLVPVNFFQPDFQLSQHRIQFFQRQMMLAMFDAKKSLV